MLHFPNYRISLKKNITSKKNISSKENISLKTLSNFKSSNGPIINEIKNKLIQKHKSKQSFKSMLSNTQKIMKSKYQQKQNKTFCFDSSDQYIKRILLLNQWQLMPQQISTNKLKWLTIVKPHHFQALQSTQLINHFKHSYRLTTKLGLYNLLSSPHQQALTNDQGKNYLEYFPRSYDLGSEFDQFIDDFLHTSIQNLMKKLMIHIQILHENTLYKKYKKICQGKSYKNKQQNILDNIKNLFDKNNQIFEKQIYQQRIFINKTIFINLIKYWRHYLQGNSFQQINYSTALNYLKAYSKLTPPFNNSDIHFKNNSQIGFLTHSSAILFFQLYFYCLQQNKYFLSDGLNNVWIIKSNQSSRGRNIFLIEDIEEAQPYRNGGNKIIQKYIENVWILNQAQQEQIIKNPKIQRILNKKFDIRFWVLVKSFLPLEAYIFEEGYLRLSSNNYKFKTNNSLNKQLKSHLTNFSINFKQQVNKSSQTKNQSLKQQNNQSKQDNSYLLFSDFISYIQRRNKQFFQQEKQQSFLFTKIKQKIQHILTTASINWRSQQTDENSFQLFGFDIILDSELQPYVLQCNMSPACHQRGQLKQLVQDMGKSMLQIIGIIKNQSINQSNLNINNQIKSKKRKWIKFNSESLLNESISKKQAIVKNYFQNILIQGQPITSKQIFEKQGQIDFLQKIILLQRFFRNRYKIKSNQQLFFNNKNIQQISRSCLMIQILAKIFKKRSKKWIKKYLKYTKKYIKRKFYINKIDSKILIN